MSRPGLPGVWVCAQTSDVVALDPCVAEFVGDVIVDHIDGKPCRFVRCTTEVWRQQRRAWSEDLRERVRAALLSAHGPAAIAVLDRLAA